MEPPPVQYVKTAAGVSIAYAVSGAGQPLVIFGPALGGMAHLWGFYPDWIQGLAARFQVIQHDMYGHGMSDRGLPADFRVGDDNAAVDALFDRVRLDRAILYGLAGVGHGAIRFAAAHPERVAALVLNGTSVGQAMRSFYHDLSAENWEFFLRSLVPSTLDADAARRCFENYLASTTPEDWRVRVGIAGASRIEEDLARLRVPTLVLHPKGSPFSSLESARQITALIPGAHLVLIEGDRPPGDASEGVAAIERFLDELPARQPLASQQPSGLSAREMEVLSFVAAGKSNPQIAAELVISLNTVQRHVSNILAKTGLSNRTEAADYAHRHGLA